VLNHLCLSKKHSQFSQIQRRIRHVTSIQVRNLTPFPVRDSLTAVLSKPTEQRELGHVSDDLDTLSLKRTRRTSTHSISTLRSLRSDEGDAPGANSDRGRRRADSKVSVQDETRQRTSSSAGRTAPTIRPHRVRTTSLVSSLFAPHHSGQDNTEHRFSVSPEDNSQTTLEKIIQSRLVETFLGIIVPPQPDDELSSPPSSPRSPHSRTRTPHSPLSPKTNRGSSARPREAKTSTSAPPDKLKNSRHESLSSIGAGESPAPTSNGHSRSLSTASQAKAKPFPSALNTSHPAPSTSKSSSSSNPMPDYVSPIHRASTNPLFLIDPRSEMPSTNISGDRFKVVLWAKIGADRKASNSVNGKGKEKEKSERNPIDDWQILEEWEVELNGLVPLPDDVSPSLCPIYIF